VPDSTESEAMASEVPSEERENRSPLGPVYVRTVHPEARIATGTTMTRPEKIVLPRCGPGARRGVFACGIWVWFFISVYQGW